MEQLIDFFINIGKLKRKKRKGWIVLHQLKTETTADHLFRCGILAWVLGRRKNLDLERVIKMALIHDLCEVYAEDETPYDPLLPKDMDKEKTREIIKRRSRVQYTPRERKERLGKKFQREAEGLERLTSELPPNLKFEIRALWLDYEKRMSKEGRFVKQIDKIENLLQALEYWRENNSMIQRDLWIIATREWITDPYLIEFLEALGKKFLSEGLEQKEKNEMQNLVDFFIEVGKLKRMPRRGWVINQIENPESIAEHISRAAIMTWILGERKRGLNIERLLKMALIHDLCEVYAGDQTPYDSVLPGDKEELRELMKTWPRFSNSEKKRIVREKHKREAKGLERLTVNLPQDLKKEIKILWLDYEKRLTKEGRFFQQADRAENLLQALEYWSGYKKPPIKPWWLWAREFFSEPLLLEFVGALDKKFHSEKS